MEKDYLPGHWRKLRKMWNIKTKILSYAVEPIIESLANDQILSYCKSLIERICYDNISIDIYTIQNKIDQFIGKEYDCEFQEVERTIQAYRNFFAYRTMLIIKCAFMPEKECVPMVDLLFNQLNKDLDTLYIEQFKNNAKEGQRVDFLLESPMSDIGQTLLDSLVSQVTINSKEIVQSYRDVMVSQLKVLGIFEE